ncbi:bacteriohemerythrin [Desulfococcaceae bacterium HSG8]|nr:bacteriohemerythrin [Desulfococcaceae bacterium HSG8]
MPLFQWTNDISVGVEVLDKHHQKLVDIVNQLHNAMREGRAKGVIVGIVNELLDYTKYHFKEEEKLMERISYSAIDEHKRAHGQFISTAQNYKAQAENGLETFLSVSVSLMLTDWLKNHIGIMDKKYQKEMNENGIT